MLGDECGDFFDAVVGHEERAQPDGAIEHLVQLLDIGDAFRLRQLEKFLVEPLGRHRHLARRHDVLDRQRRLVLDRLLDRIFVEIAALVLRAENLERAFALLGLGDRRPGEADDRGVRHGGHQVGAEVLSDRTMRLVDEDVDVVAGAAVLPDRLKLVDHRDDQAAKIRIEQLLQFGLGVGALGGDVLLLHFAEQSLDPALHLAFEFGAIDDEDHRRVLEPLLLSSRISLRRGQQREGLARSLRVPDEAARLCRIGASGHDRVDGAALMLPQHRFLGLAVLNVEQNPMLQRAQKIRALEEGLHREAIGLVRRLLPARHVAAGGVPGDAVPVIEQVGDVEELRRADQFRRLDLVAAQLLDAALDRIAILGVLVLDDADRNAVDEEHHVGAIALAGGRLQRPFPRDVKDVASVCSKSISCDAAMALFVLVVPAVARRAATPASPDCPRSSAGWHRAFR